MAKFSFTNWTGQIPGSDFLSNPLLATGKAGEMTLCNIDPNRFPSVLSPFPGGTALTNAASITTSVTKMVNYIGDTPLIFGIGSDKVYEIVPSSDTVTNTGNFPHTIAAAGAHVGHTTFVASDIVIYENNGTYEVFYSYNDNTDGGIGRLSAIPATDTFDDDYWTAVVGGTALNKNFPHPMAIGDNNICYIGNGSILASMDLRTGTPAAVDTEIDLLGGWIIKDHISHKGFHWILARETHSGDNPDTRQTGRCAVFVWDYVKSTFDEIYFLDDTDGYRIFIHDGEIMTITGSSTIARMRIFTGSTFKPIPNVIYNNGVSATDAVTLGGIAIRNGILMWTSKANGEVHSYGSIRGAKSYNQLIDLGTSAHAIISKPFGSDTFYIASGTAVKKYDFSSSGNYDLASFYRSPMQIFPNTAVIKEFRVYYPSITAGNDTDKFNLVAHFNGADSGTTIGSIGFDDADKGYKRIPFVRNNVYSISVDFTYSGSSPASTCILPYRIDVVYELTDKR